MIEASIYVEYIYSTTDKSLWGRIMGKNDIIRILRNYKKEFANP